MLAGPFSFASFFWASKKKEASRRAAPADSRVSRIGALFAMLFAANAFALPAFNTVKAQHHSSDAWLLDRHGELLQTVRLR